MKSKQNRQNRRTVRQVQGYCQPEFSAVEKVFRRQLRGTRGGASVCVYYRGQPVVDIWGGARDESGQAWEADTLAPSYSTTKGVASTLLHLLADRGQIDYDAPVATYWPGFGKSGKHGITLRQVLTHQAGLFHIRKMVDRAERMLDWDYMVQALENAEPAHLPGARTAYHGLTYGYLVGEIVRRVSGRELGQFLHEELAAPLGLDGLYIGAPDDAIARCARLIRPASLGNPATQLIGYSIQQYLTGMSGFLQSLGIDSQLGSFHDALAPRGMRRLDFNDPATLREPIPSANGIFTARSLAAMYAMLAGGGSLGGKRLLSNQTVQKLSNLAAAPGRYAVIPFNMRWRLGYHGVYSSTGFRESAYGHFGFGGSGGWADPDLDLAVAMITNSGQGSTFGDSRIARISGAVLKAIAEVEDQPMVQSLV